MPSPQSIVADNGAVLGSVPVATAPLKAEPSTALTAEPVAFTGSFGIFSMNVCTGVVIGKPVTGLLISCLEMT